MLFIETLLEELKEVTLDQIELALGALKPPGKGETVVCRIDSERAMRLWALAHQYDGKQMLIAHQIHYSANKAEQAALYIQIEKFRAMENACRELAWIEIRFAVGEENANWDSGIGLCEGFMLTKGTSSDCPTFGELVGGIAVSGQVMGAIQEMIRQRRREQEEAKAEKEKVQ